MDEDLRRLERAAAQGDRDARLALLRQNARAGGRPQQAALDAFLAARNARKDYPISADDAWSAIRKVVSATGLAHAFVQKVAHSPRVPGPARNAGRRRASDIPAVRDVMREADEAISHLTDAERRGLFDEMDGAVSLFHDPREGFSFHVALLAVVTGPASPVAFGMASAWLAKPDPPLDAFWPRLSSISEPARVKRLSDWASSRGPDRMHVARDEAKAILGV